MGEECGTTTQAAYSCPQDGCTRVFSEALRFRKNICPWKNVISLWKSCLYMDHAKVEYKAFLEEGVGVLPNLSPVLTWKTADLQIVKEGWALSANKKACRFNESQKKYLSAKFNIGQATGRKMDADSVAKDMRRALSTDGVHLFKVSEFLTSQQITSYFSRLALRARQQSPDSDDIQAAEEEKQLCFNAPSCCIINSASTSIGIQPIRYL